MSSSLQLNWMGIENKWVVPTNLTLEVWSVLRSDPGAESSNLQEEVKKEDNDGDGDHRDRHRH